MLKKVFKHNVETVKQHYYIPKYVLPCWLGYYAIVMLKVPGWNLTSHNHFSFLSWVFGVFFPLFFWSLNIHVIECCFSSCNAMSLNVAFPFAMLFH